MESAIAPVDDEASAECKVLGPAPGSPPKLRLMARFKSSSTMFTLSGTGGAVGWEDCKLCRMALFKASWSSSSSICFQLISNAAWKRAPNTLESTAYALGHGLFIQITFNSSSSSSGSCFLVKGFLKWRGERGATLNTLSASQAGRSPTTIKIEYLSVCSCARNRDK